MKNQPVRAASDESRWARNEAQFMIQEFGKREVFTELAYRLWGNQTTSLQQQLERRLSDALTISSSRLLLGSGPTALLKELFSQFAPFAANVVIAKPSAPFYEKLANRTGVKPIYWAHTNDFQYHEALFPAIKPDSLVLLASPNPITGVGITEAVLINLLKTHRDTLFIVDETYASAPADNLLRLSLQYSNLVLVRSLVVTGTKLGYVVAEPYLIKTLRSNKPILSLNHISDTNLNDLLTLHLQQDFLQNQADLIAQRRNRFYEQLSAILAPTFLIHNTESNFVLVQAYDQHTYRLFAQLLAQLDIEAIDLHLSQHLSYTFQLPVGKAQENEWLINRLADAMAPLSMLLFL